MSKDQRIDKKIKEIKDVDKESFNVNAGWRSISKGGIISSPGSAHLFKTGDWRAMKPVWIEEKCTQCLLCYPVCPDTAILINEEGQRVDFDFDHCKGCGICVKVCPFDAIEFVEESN